jgi:hypothetical protein
MAGVEQKEAAINRNQGQANDEAEEQKNKRRTGLSGRNVPLPKRPVDEG